MQPKRRVKKLHPATGIDLSRLKDNWEECDFRYNVSMDPDDWHDAVYRRYNEHIIEFRGI